MQSSQALEMAGEGEGTARQGPGKGRSLEGYTSVGGDIRMGWEEAWEEQGHRRGKE